MMRFGAIMTQATFFPLGTQIGTQKGSGCDVGLGGPSYFAGMRKPAFIQLFSDLKSN
jgi:hypothetical protein